MKCAVITLSRKSLELAQKIKSKIDDQYVDIYTMPKYVIDGVKTIEGGLKHFNRYLFENYSTLVYIMATGIVVRDIQPYLKHKSVDPAVLVIDSNGDFVISLLSGHLGGANEKTRVIANKIGATPVITTASDCNNKMAVDMFAKNNDLVISNFTDAKKITALAINDEKIGLINTESVCVDETEDMVLIEDVKEDNVCSGYVVVTNKKNVAFTKPFVRLIPKNIVLGVGCRKGKTSDEISQFINNNLDRLDIDVKAVYSIASIDLKKEEEGIIEFAKKLKIPFITYSKDELKTVDYLFTGSEFVRQITGVGAVCQSAGCLASDKGICLIKKVKKEGMTLSIWRKE